MTIRFARAVHPGEYLREEYLLPLAISAESLAKRLNLPRRRIERLIREEAGITPDTALRLARAFATTPQFWLNFQNAYDLEIAARKVADSLARIEPIIDTSEAA
ncbi:HigA family addiction module antitoxin [Jiella sonneratiae]|uniref:HigA family addiction module antidote protein n=1 Tax=Jiella sonneratiae TaxID=2816856 RepID=A0ABS3J3Y3_9HYPH|nr:HigA family addiction module antitoxin [Jiella sonneratiae]MBO0904381.1 HigA family addiction module antidote protein [Jiella sonneratiae]